MIIITCIDDNMGMMFNHRRQSQDRILLEHVVQLAAGSRLWMNHYSANQFEFADAPQINIDDNFMAEARNGEYCFVEDVDIQPYKKCIEKIIFFKWNRKYPADQVFPIVLDKDGWQLLCTKDFSGSSHEKITEETYTK